jgi:VCBS repeat-containing protein
MRTSPYVTAVPTILADTEQSRAGADNPQPDQENEPGGEALEKWYVYRTDTGGWLASPTKIGEEDPSTDEDGQPQAPIVESLGLETDTRPTIRHDPPYFLHFLLLLLLFIGLDNLDSVFAQFAPTANVTLTPMVKTITTSARFPVGPGGVQGQVLPALTLSQSQTVAATGRGHQDAQYASGTLTFYNGQLQSIMIASGTPFTGKDGVQVVTTETARIPAADLSTNPPTYGHVDIPAQAVQKGTQGNIAALDLSRSCCAASVIVKNLAPFTNGRDARDFTYVQSSDIRQATSALTTTLLQSEQGALSGQLQPGEALTTPTCTPRVFSNHRPNDEAASVAVTVSETCRAIAFSQQSLQQAAMQLVHHRLQALNAAYQLIGSIQVTVRSASTQYGSPALTATMRGLWVYQVNESQIKALVAGKPRLEAFQLLQRLPGVQTVSITGIADNQQLPTDVAHIHLSIFYLAS